ncbi:MAG: META domain-containing protein [Bacteroidales bacterium]|nr:META domain-containing protein [Bacteroidales bacterium]
MKSIKWIMGIVLVTLLVSCGTGKDVKSTDENAICEKWELSTIDGIQVTGNQPIYIELTEDNKVMGFAGCNQLTGTYTIENETQIKFDKLALTRMACPEMEIELESKVLDLLNTCDNFIIEDGKLMLNAANKESLATFCIMSDDEIVNKYWKLVELEGETVQMDANQEREQYFILRSDGSISGFAGCNHFTGQYELSEGNRISIKENMAMSLMACPDLDIDESAFMQVFELTDNYTIEGDVLNLNVGKRAPLAVFEAVYF